MPWQQKYKDEDKWNDVEFDRIERVLSSTYHQPRAIIREMKENPGREINTMFSHVRYIEETE
jgi:hypothetical protein